MKRIRLYLRVTQDKYELPIAVFTSKTELAKFEGVKVSGISTYVRHCKQQGAYCKYQRVELSIDEDEIPDIFF